MHEGGEVSQRERGPHRSPVVGDRRIRPRVSREIGGGQQRAPPLSLLPTGRCRGLRLGRCGPLLRLGGGGVRQGLVLALISIRLRVQVASAELPPLPRNLGAEVEPCPRRGRCDERVYGVRDGAGVGISVDRTLALTFLGRGGPKGRGRLDRGVRLAVGLVSLPQCVPEVRVHLGLDLDVEGEVLVLLG